MSSDKDNRLGEAKYDIGYGKPPRVGCFRPGESGNPKGRPKKKKDQEAKSLAAAFAGALDEEITVQDGARQVRLTRKQMLVRSLVEKSAKGSKRALRKLLTLRDAVEKSPDAPVVLKVTEISATANGRPIKHIEKPVWYVDGQDIPVGSEEEPKIVPSFRALIEIELERQVWVNGPGARRRMVMREIIATQFTNAAASGDEGAIELLLKLGVHENRETSKSKVRFMVVPSTPEDLWRWEHQRDWQRNWEAAGCPSYETDEEYFSFYPPMPK